MENIVDFSIKNWRVTLGLMFFAVIGGLLAMARLPLDAEPDIPVPFVNVQVIVPGISPEDAERLLVRPMEKELKAVEGLRQMDGIAATNVAYMVLEFNASFDQDKAVQEINEKVDKARADFPSEARQPIVEEISTSTFPVVVVNLFGAAPERELQFLAKDLQRKLEGIPAVLEAKISGERTDVLEAVIDPSLMDSTGITFDEISAAVARNNSLVAAGALETANGRFNVKLPGLIENPADLSELVIRTGQNGAIVKMSDIATVRKGYKDVTSFARFDGRTSVSVEVSKRQGENIIETIEKVRALVDEAAASPAWPETVNVAFSQDRSREIREMVASLFSSIVNAVILVFIVCIAALGWRSALFVGFAIPASFLMALFMFYVQGASINMMIMFGLILSVGVLVDSAIVIVEFADRKLAEGFDRVEAYTQAGKRMFWPIVSSTATTLAAFLPLLFWDDVTGKFMSYFPRTMIFVLTASLLMAVIFLPTLGALIGPRKISKSSLNAQALSGDGGDPMQTRGLTGIYVRIINKMIRFPFVVIGVTAIVLIAIVFNFSAMMKSDPPKQVEYFTQAAGDRIFVLARSRGNTTPQDALNIALDIENRIKDVQGIQSVYTVAGAAAGGSGAGGEALSGPSNVPSDTVVKIFTELKAFEDRPSSNEIMDDIRRAVDNVPGVYTEVSAVSQGPPIGKDIAVQLSSDTIEDLQAATRRVRDKFLSMDGIYEVEDTLPLPGIEWQLRVNRSEAGRLGLDVSRIGAAVSFLTEGTLVGQYRPLDATEEVDIRIRFPAGSRDLRELDTLRIQTREGSLPLSNVVTQIAKPRQDKIERRDQSLVYEVKANTRDGFATNQQVNIIKDWLADEADLPATVDSKFLGQEEENAAAGQFFLGAGIAILFMMSVILLLQFNSFYHVFLTLLAVILSVFGVILGLTYYPYISIILSGTGVIALAGIVVNNNIVLIDSYQQLLKRGYNPVDAVVRTAAQRLRPVFLTTLTTVVGLMPLVLGWQADIFTGEFSFKGTSTSTIWAPISYVIASGLTFATVLTLFITPVLLAMPAIVKERLQRRGIWQFKPAASSYDDAEKLPAQ